MKTDVFGTADRRLIADVRLLARRCARRLRRAPVRVNIVFVNDRYLRGLNRRFLGRDRPTDVISFPPAPGPASRTGDVPPAEVYVSRDQARIQAREYGVSYGEELRRLVLHGLLHLAGLTHRRMRAHEAGLLGRR
ncbi:rRNA maturation RNase YbeY [candidate division WOR-3 bacterium]|nr:rRNA maturation RNase YbeY [candidate division WOR-3 bacterium]